MRESQYLEGRGEICHEQSWKRKQTLLTVLEKIYEVIERFSARRKYICATQVHEYCCEDVNYKAALIL